MNTKRLMLSALLGITALGVAAPAVTNAYADKACMEALETKRPWLSYEQRVTKCTPERDTLVKNNPTFPAMWTAGGSIPYSDGNWNLEIGTALWGFTLNAYYQKNWIPPLFNSWYWDRILVQCFRHTTVYVALELDVNDPNECGVWSSGGGKVGGAKFTVKFTVPPIEFSEPQFAVFRFYPGQPVTFHIGRGHNP